MPTDSEFHASSGIIFSRRFLSYRRRKIRCAIVPVADIISEDFRIEAEIGVKFIAE
jgi:hypothetical protein